MCVWSDCMNVDERLFDDFHHPPQKIVGDFVLWVRSSVWVVLLEFPNWNLDFYLIIISGCCCTLLNIGLPNLFPAWPVGCHLHPTTPCSLNEVVGPSGRWPSHAALSHTWSPLQYLFDPRAVSSSRYCDFYLMDDIRFVFYLMGGSLLYLSSFFSLGSVIVISNPELGFLPGWS